MMLPKKQDLNLVISQEIRKTMEERGILIEDIEEVILHSFISGERFYNPEDSSYLANLRIKNVTYWVLYTEDEKEIQVISVYSHRMKVTKE